MKSSSNIFGGLVPQDQPEPQQQPASTGNMLQAVLDGNAFDKQKLDRLFKYPANLKEAKVHKIASKFGYSHYKLANGEHVPVCPCCENHTSTMEIPLCYSTTPDPPQQGNQVFLVATDCSLYFIFVKMVIYYLVLKVLIFDAFTVYASSTGSFCNNYHTANPSKTCAYTLSGYNLKSASDQSMLNIVDILALAFTIFSVVFFVIFRKRMAKVRDWLDFSTISQDDYTVLVEDIPKFIFDEGTTKSNIEFEYKVQLEEVFEARIHEWLRQLHGYTDDRQCKDRIEKDFYKFVFKKFQTEDGDNLLLYDDQIVTSITLCYDLTQIENLTNFRQQLVDQFVAKNTSDVELESTDQIAYLPNQIDVINREFINLCEQFALNDTPSFSLSKFTGKAFISFQYQHYRDYFAHEYTKNPKFLELCGSPLRVSKTNQPTDIFWYNMKISDAQRSKDIFYSYCVLFMLLILSFAALVGLQFWQIAQSKAHVGTSFTAKLVSYGISGSMAVLTNIINYILSSSIEVLADMERHKTKSDRTGQLILKIVISQFLNTSIIYTILYLLKPLMPLETYGMVAKINSLIVVSGAINIIFQVVLPSYTISYFLNRRKYTEQKPINLFQIQLNKALEYPPFPYAQNYAFYIIYCYVVCWYGFIFPIGTIYLIVIFIIEYWVDKYNFFRRYSNPVAFGQDLVKLVTVAFQFSLFLFAGGYFFWQADIAITTPSIYRILNIITLAIALIWAIISIFVSKRIKDKIFGEDDISFERLTYVHYRNRGDFTKTYFRESPATFCLKETKLRKKADPREGAAQAVNEADDPQFVKEPHFDRYIDMKDDERFIDTYDKQMGAYAQNKGNEDFDYASDEEGQEARQKAKTHLTKIKKERESKRKQ